MPRTQEQRIAAKRRRELRKQRQTRQDTYDNPDQRFSKAKTPVNPLLSDTQILMEIRRLPQAARYWYEDMTTENKRELLGIVRCRIESPRSDDDNDLATMIFDGIYEMKDQHKIVRGNGIIAPTEEVQDKRRERRLRRKMQREQEMGVNQPNSKSQNNPLQESKNVIRSSYGSREPNKKITGDNIMILVNEKHGEFKFKVRTKGAPNYADSGDNREITIDGKKATFVLNPKKENNTSKRVGFRDAQGRWLFVDNEEVHAAVKGFKGTVAFTQKQRGNGAEKPEKKTKEKAAPKQEKKADKKAAAPKGKKASKAAEASAE